MKKIGLLGKLILGILGGTVSGKNSFKCIKNYLPAYFTALGTQSSAATIPVSMECARKNEISEEVVDFVAPLGEVSTGLCPEPLKTW